jgi:hypothetical protein
MVYIYIYGLYLHLWFISTINHSDFPLPNFGREPLQGQRQLNLTAGRWRWPTPRGQHGDAEVDTQILTELMDPMGKPREGNL